MEPGQPRVKKGKKLKRNQENLLCDGEGLVCNEEDSVRVGTKRGVYALADVVYLRVGGALGAADSISATPELTKFAEVVRLRWISKDDGDSAGESLHRALWPIQSF